MAATILTNLAEYTMGIPVAESGMNVETVNISVKGTEIKVPDHNGNTTGLVQHDFEQVFKVKGFLVGAAAMKPGDIITPANTLTGIGVASGAVIVGDVAIDYKNTDLARIDYTATQRLGIPVGATQVLIPAA